MGSFFAPKAPAPPPMPTGLTESQKRAEERADAQERNREKKIAAQQNVRRTGGSRLLLADRENARLGIPTGSGATQTKLGSSSV